MAILRIANINKSYNITKTQKQDVLKGVTLDFDNGEIVGLLGESGCGKSTLINIIGGLDTEYTGSVVLKGEFLNDFTEDKMDDYRKKKVGLIFQNYNLIGHMSVIENIEIVMSMNDLDEKLKKERALDLLRLVGLENFKDKMPNQLSGGQKQRIAIARALANNPNIILADEPTGALDKDSTILIMEIFKKIAKMGKLVIIVTHSELIASNCSRVIKLDDGIVVSDETRFKYKIEDKRISNSKPKSIKAKELFKLSYRNLKQTFSRSILVGIGMAIGILSFVLILCLSDGLKNYVDSVYSSELTSTQVVVYKSSYSTITSSELEDVESISAIKSINSSYISTNSTYTVDELELSGSLGSISAYYDDFYPEILYGEINTNSGNIIINQALAKSINEENMILSLGNTLTITLGTKVSSYTITGIYQDNTSDTSKLNCFISDTDLRSNISTYTNILYLNIRSASYVTTVIDDLTSLGYKTYQASTEVNTVMSYIDMGTTVLTCVSCISLIVAAIMIFIVLYISIVERTKEIGILRAVGARKKDIRIMFIFEATMLGFLGGILGVGFTFIISLITNIISYFTLESTLISYNVLYYFLGIILSTVISLLAGIAPANKGSSLDPVESLRFE